MATMAATKKKAIALLTTAAGLGILLVAGVVLYRPLEEQYWLWKLREGDESEKEEAADRLAELEVEEAIPILVDLIPRQLPEWHSPPWIDLVQGIPQEPYWLRALVKQEELAVPYLRGILNEESVQARSYVVYILGKIGPPAIDVAPDLVEAALRSKPHPDATTTSPREAHFFMNALDRKSVV